MPPVMGAAAFLMAEYVGVSYVEICEALKAGIKGLPPRAGNSALGRIAGILMTLAGLVIFANAIYYGLGWIKDPFPQAALWIIQGRIRAGLHRHRRRGPGAAAAPGVALPAPALALLGGVVLLQRRRIGSAGQARAPRRGREAPGYAIISIRT